MHTTAVGMCFYSYKFIFLSLYLPGEIEECRTINYEFSFN